MIGIEEFPWLWYKPGPVSNQGDYVSRGRITIDLAEVVAAAAGDNLPSSCATQIWFKGSAQPQIVGINYDDFLKLWHPR